MERHGAQHTGTWTGSSRRPHAAPYPRARNRLHGDRPTLLDDACGHRLVEIADAGYRLAPSHGEDAGNQGDDAGLARAPADDAVELPNARQADLEAALDQVGAFVSQQAQAPRKVIAFPRSS
jgi:hypothetical protein